MVRRGEGSGRSQRSLAARATPCGGTCVRSRPAATGRGRRGRPNRTRTGRALPSGSSRPGRGGFQRQRCCERSPSSVATASSANSRRGRRRSSKAREIRWFDSRRRLASRCGPTSPGCANASKRQQRAAGTKRVVQVESAIRAAARLHGAAACWSLISPWSSANGKYQHRSSVHARIRRFIGNSFACPQGRPARLR
jgi:hypothetical protein